MISLFSFLNNRNDLKELDVIGVYTIHVEIENLVIDVMKENLKIMQFDIISNEFGELVNTEDVLRGIVRNYNEFLMVKDSIFSSWVYVCYKNKLSNQQYKKLKDLIKNKELGNAKVVIVVDKYSEIKELESNNIVVVNGRFFKYSDLSSYLRYLVAERKYRIDDRAVELLVYRLWDNIEEYSEVLDFILYDKEHKNSEESNRFLIKYEDVKKILEIVDKKREYDIIKLVEILFLGSKGRIRKNSKKFNILNKMKDTEKSNLIKVVYNVYRVKLLLLSKGKVEEEDLEHLRLRKNELIKYMELSRLVSINDLIFMLNELNNNNLQIAVYRILKREYLKEGA